MKNVIRFMTRWYWVDGPQEWRLQTTVFGHIRAKVVANGAVHGWYTFDKRGNLGENDNATEVSNAKRTAYYACISQGWL